MQSFGIFWPTRYPWLPAWTNSALWFSYRKDLFSGWRSIFWFICELFCEKLPIDLTFFSVWTQKRTKLVTWTGQFSGFWEFCVQMKAKKLGCPQITAQSCVFSLSPLFLTGGLFLVKCLNFFYEQFILWVCLLVQIISFDSFDKILCKTCLDWKFFANQLQIMAPGSLVRQI